MALFDDEKDEIEDNLDFEETEHQSVFIQKRDKIFNNDYNTGNLEFEEYGMPKVDQDFVESNMECYYNSSEYHEKKNIMETLDKYFQESTLYSQIGMKKKIPKQILCKIYLEMKEAFSNSISEMDYFIGVAEYFGTSYELLYENIPAVNREKLVEELDGKYSVLKKRGIKKLF